MSSSSNTKPELRLDWCSYQAAKYACEHWHYSGCVPAGKLVKIGVWENKQFIGAVLFSWGANRNIGSPYGLQMNQCCELVRIALANHHTPVTRILKIAISMFKKQSPGIALIVSYADQNQDHHGGIYQGGNWFYVGQTGKDTNNYCPDWSVKFPDGRLMHRKTYASKYGTTKPREIGLEYFIHKPKHKYLYLLTPEMRAKIEPLAKPYPKRAPDKGNHPDQGQGGGAIPTQALHPSPIATGGTHD
jgi:hypothetical protein